MSNTTSDRPAFLPKIATSPPILTDEQIELLEATSEKYHACRARLIQVEGVKQVLRRASTEFAKGKITLAEATALCAVTNSSTERHALQKTLNHAVKNEIKTVLAEAHQIVILAAAHRHAELLEKCQSVEDIERDTAEDLGISAEDFTASPNLVNLRHVAKSAGRTLEVHRSNTSASAVELREVCTLAGVGWNEPDRSAIFAAMLADDDDDEEGAEAPDEVLEDDDTVVETGDLDELDAILKIDLDTEPLTEAGA